MKKLFVIILALILCLLPVFCFAQIWEGDGGDAIQEGLGFSSGSGGGWIPEPLDPNMTHYVISFKDDNQTTSLFSPIELNENTVVDLSIFAPTRSVGYDFDHWEDSNGDPVTSVTMTADTTVYAVWTVHTHSITWQVTDYSKEPAAVYTSVDNNVAYGSIIVASSTPTVPQNYEFSGWNNLPSTMPDYDLVVTGTIEQLDLIYKIVETPFDSHQSSTTNQRYTIEYAGSLVDKSPITYNNGVVDMGYWESWINNHFTPVMLKSDGTVDYELSRTNQNYKADGVTPSDVSNINYDGNAMVRIKKFYISCSTEEIASGTDLYKVHTIRISDFKKNNTYTCWGFVDANGTEQDYAYYGMFMCHVDSNSKLRSIGGVTLTSTNHLKTYSDIITAAHANGNGFSISNMALENAVGLALMMVFKNINPMFVQRENNVTASSFIFESQSNYAVTGTRANTDSCPYCETSSVPVKALWIEGYWRSNGNSIGFAPWLAGFGGLKDTSAPANNLSLVYKLKEPYDLTDINSWTKSNIPYYYYNGNSHQIQSMMFENNLLVPADQGSGWTGTGFPASSFYKFLGSGDLNGNSYSTYFSTTEIRPGKKGGALFVKDILTPHFVSYGVYGSRSGDIYQKASGRLTYLPQPSSLLSINRNLAPSLKRLNENLVEPEPIKGIATDTGDIK